MGGGGGGGHSSPPPTTNPPHTPLGTTFTPHPTSAAALERQERRM